LQLQQQQNQIENTIQTVIEILDNPIKPIIENKSFSTIEELKYFIS
jgi:hypothetical protein